ncbi:MAG: hypothetical protein HZA32_04875 [Opitutae bacterium]|nr:hypothetical protein [Opitutae bacterium]
MKSKMFRVISMIALAATLATAGYATVESLFVANGGANGGFATVDLNAYGTYVDSISVEADAYGYEPDYTPIMNGPNEFDPRVAATIFLRIGSQQYTRTANEFCTGILTMSGIYKNESGDWIASQASFPGGSVSDVNLGSGIVEVEAWAQANGIGYCSASSQIVY